MDLGGRGVSPGATGPPLFWAKKKKSQEEEKPVEQAE